MPTRQRVNIAAVLVSIVALGAILYFGRPVLLPLALGGVLAMLFDPFVRWLESKGWRKGWALATCVLIVALLVVALGGLLFSQATLVVNDWPKIQERLLAMRDSALTFAQERFGISEDQIGNHLQRETGAVGQFAQLFFGSLTTIVVGFFLSIASMVLFLLEKRRLHDTVLMLIDRRKHDTARAAMARAGEIAHCFLLGQFKVIGVLAVVYTVGFLCGGVKYAIFLAIVAAMFNIVPYVGNIFGGGIAVVLAVASGGWTGGLVVVGVMTASQLTENYVLQPLIVGKAVNVNPWATIVGMLLFGSLWGVAGTLIAMPILGILKEICDHWEGFEPFGYLLGNDPPPGQISQKR